MIYVNTDGLENISDLLTGITSVAENEFYRAKSVMSEIQGNPKFQSYPQYIMACDYMAHATDELFRLQETLRTLMTLLISASEDYKTEEKKRIELLHKVTDCLAKVDYTISAAIQSDGKSEVETSQEMVDLDELQKMVEEDLLSIEMINIAAVSRKVQEEYEVTKVTPIEQKLFVEGKRSNESEEDE